MPDPADEPDAGQVRRPHRWNAARTDPRPGMVVVAAVLGRSHRDVRLDAVERPDEVELHLSVVGPSRGRASGHLGNAQVRLAAPLDGRPLRDPVTGHLRHAFDGSRLVTPSPLPAGFLAGLEQPHPDWPDEGGPPSHWCRAYGPPEPGGTRVELWQGAGPPYDLSRGDEWGVRGTIEVDGQQVPLWRSRAVSAASLTWRHDSTDLTVMAHSPRAQDPLPGLQTFLRALSRRR